MVLIRSRSSYNSINFPSNQMSLQNLNLPLQAAPQKTNNNSRFAHQFLHHSQFANKDKGDGTLSQHTKQLIIQGARPEYNSEKLKIRNADRISLLVDGRTIAMNLQKRKDDIQVRGFKSDSREPYKPLGDLYLDPEALIFNALSINNVEKSVKAKENSKSTEKVVKSEIVQEERRSGNILPQNQSNGFFLIKNRLVKSKIRLNTVKFGLPFLQVLDDHENEESRVSSPQVEDQTSTPVDFEWKDLKIDPERRVYFQALNEKRNRVNAPTQNIKEVANQKEPPSPKIFKTKTISKFGSQKAMEQSLNITRVDRNEESTRQFLVSREKCVEQRHRLTHLLYEDLYRFDRERRQKFTRKFKYFDVNKECNLDLDNMRSRAETQCHFEKNNILKSHSWFNDLLNKIVSKRKIGHYEQLLIDRVRGVVEDGLDFSQATFVKILKVIPTDEFTTDEIQRIIRFIKQHETISERDYIEAIELAGHSI